jgi:hypothetical protein
MNTGVSLLERFKVNHPHRLFIYLSAIIFVSSLFFETKVIDSSIVQGTSLRVLLIGTIVWIIYTLLESFQEYYQNEDTYSEFFATAWGVSLFLLEVVYTIVIIWLIM